MGGTWTTASITRGPCAKNSGPRGAHPRIEMGSRPGTDGAPMHFACDDDVGIAAHVHPARRIIPAKAETLSSLSVSVGAALHGVIAHAQHAPPLRDARVLWFPPITEI